MKRWSAHTDCINWISFVPELDSLASCSFDCNVYIWNTDCEKIGSLVLGLEKLWKIKIDKTPRQNKERVEAEDYLDTVGSIDYERMFMKTKKEIGSTIKERPLIQALKSEQKEDLLTQDKRFESMTEDE